MQVRSKQQLPTKWLVAIVGVLILYGLTQPILAGRFGWPLPSLAKLLGQDDSGDEKSVEPRQEPSSPNATPGNQGTGNQGTGSQGTGNQSPGQSANSETSETELL
ncbi:MAG: hypothetical protein R3C53_23505, partial [Pirellulaceae bacterium]